MTKKDMIKAARELNKVLGLDPRIDIKQPIEKLKAELETAADLIEPADELSEPTMKVIEWLQSGEEAEEQDEEPIKETVRPLTEQEIKDVTPASKPKPVVKGRPQVSEIVGKVSGKKKLMTDIMDEIIIDGGPWEDLVSQVKTRAEQSGYDPSKYTRDTIREHAKYRLNRGWVNIDFDGEVQITITPDGIDVKEL